jgi:hypothetical protein
MARTHEQVFSLLELGVIVGNWIAGRPVLHLGS